MESKTLDLKPSFSAAYNDLALLYYHDNKDLEHALVLADKAISIDSDIPDYYDTKIKILFKLKRYTEAIELRQNVLTSENMNSKLDYYMNQQINSGAEKREMDRWDTGYKDVRSEVLYIKDWYVKRLHQLDKLVNEF